MPLLGIRQALLNAKVATTAKTAVGGRTKNAIILRNNLPVNKRLPILYRPKTSELILY